MRDERFIRRYSSRLATFEDGEGEANYATHFGLIEQLFVVKDLIVITHSPVVMLL
jgi:hypothetical protein